ncbi:aldose 1-epimerase [uncultured Arcticibacterium sp.]|uniref:aldose 1-epimerase n=1 Tax=uncultured Arcticibacterium sp. TaxID=2173042 RepID=UPI0030F69F25
MANLILKNKIGSTVEIDLSQGATITGLHLGGEDVIKYPLKEDDPKKGYPSALLFPFPNRIKDGTYTFEEKEYTLELNDIDSHNAIHGFIAFESFDLISHTASKLVAQYNYDGYKEGYPFPFQFTVTYTLKENTLNLTVDVLNSGNGNMPMGFAWHPYFGFNSCAIGDMTVKVPRRRKIELNDRYIPTSEFEVERSEVVKLKNTILDNVYFFEKDTDVSEIELRWKKKKLKVSQKTGKNKLNYFVLYTPASRDCIAIEPQSCNTNAFNNEEGLIILKEGKKAKFEISVSVEG